MQQDELHFHWKTFTKCMQSPINSDISAEESFKSKIMIKPKIVTRDSKLYNYGILINIRKLESEIC